PARASQQPLPPAAVLHAGGEDHEPRPVEAGGEGPAEGRQGDQEGEAPRSHTAPRAVEAGGPREPPRRRGRREERLGGRAGEEGALADLGRLRALPQVLRRGGNDEARGRTQGGREEGGAGGAPKGPGGDGEEADGGGRRRRGEDGGRRRVIVLSRLLLPREVETGNINQSTRHLKN
ncbi:hypothetical protein THAOC_18632, partial [Thalassiosira oceanica]